MNRFCKPAGLRLAVSAALLAGSLAAPALAEDTPADTGQAVDLIAVYAEALKSNAGFRAQLSLVEMANHAQESTFGQLLPQADLTGVYDYGHEHVKGDFYLVPDVSESDDFPRGLVGVKLTQPLYRPDLWINDDIAELKKTQVRFQLDAAEDALLVQVAEAYFGVLAAQDGLRFADAEYQSVTRQMDQIKSRFDAGLVTEADQQAAISTQAIADAKRIGAQAALSEAYAQLDLVAGHPYRALKALPDGLQMMRPDPAEPRQWIDRARTQNQEVLAARVAVQLASLQTDKNKRLRYPHVDAIGSVKYLNNGGGITGDRDETEERIGVGVSVPIYSGGSVSALIAEAQSNQDRTQALYEASVAEAGRDVQVAYLETIAGLTQVPARKTAVEAGRAAEAPYQSGFDAGTRTSADVLKATQERYEAERIYAASRYKFIVDSLKLKRAAGNLANADLSIIDRLLTAPNPPPASATAP